LPEISLDFDLENIGAFKPALEELNQRYPGVVLVRKSSSEKGWHIWVKGIELDSAKELQVRKSFGDCAGRLAGDGTRIAGGLVTSRLFTVKGMIFNGQKVVRKAGEWLTFEEWRSRYGEESGSQVGEKAGPAQA